VICRAITIPIVLVLLAACADASATLDRKMSEIRREQCDPLPTERQRAACIQQVNDIEDEALRQFDEARRQQAIQQTVNQVRVINQTGRQW
jgi:S-adenosylhomocysteine hydrolase